MKRYGIAGLIAAGTVLVGSASAGATVSPVDVAKQAGIYEYSRTFSVTPWDYNNDWPGTYPDDFYYVRHDPQLGAANLPPSTLWRNQLGGTYADSGAVTGRTDKHGCAWGDYNGDLRPDLACAIGFGQNSRNELWRQNLDGTFTNVAGTLGVSSDTHGRYRYMTFIDANNDGYDDLYFARYYGPSYGDDGYPGDTFPNELRINQGPSAATPFAFESASGYGLDVLDGARKDAASCAQAVDYDRDGDEDLLVCGQQALKLYRNDFPGETFTPVTSAMRAGAPGVKDAAIVDLDRDSILELIKLQRSKLSIHRRPSNAVAWNKTPAYSLALSFGESLAVGDFNGDQLDDVLMVAKKGGGVGDNSDYLLLQQPGFSFASIDLGRTAGSGDDVGTVDYNRDGLADFVVTNGDMQKAGPVQLWTNQVVPLP